MAAPAPDAEVSRSHSPGLAFSWHSREIQVGNRRGRGSIAGDRRTLAATIIRGFDGRQHPRDDGAVGLSRPLGWPVSAGQATGTCAAVDRGGRTIARLRRAGSVMTPVLASR